MTVVLGIALIVMAVFLVISILLQSSKDHRLSGTIAGGAETFFGKQKGKTVDSLLNKITAVVCALFFICVIAMFIVTDNGEATPDEVPGEEQTEDEQAEDVKTEDEKTEDEKTEDEKTEDEKSEDGQTEDEQAEDIKPEDGQTEDEQAEDVNPEEN